MAIYRDIPPTYEAVQVTSEVLSDPQPLIDMGCQVQQFGSDLALMQSGEAQGLALGTWVYRRTSASSQPFTVLTDEEFSARFELVE